MRTCGRHIVVLLLAPIVLAACGGDSGSAGDGNGNNQPPVISGNPPTTISAGTAYAFTPLAVDPDGDPLTFNAENVPGWATFNTATGALTGMPSEGDVGRTARITIEVSDSKSTTQLPEFRIDVTSTATTPPQENRAPTIAGSPATTARVGRVYVFRPVGDDPDDDEVSFEIVNKPTWATFTPSTGELRGTPTSDDVGAYEDIVIRVTDGQLEDSLNAFDIEVVPSTTTPPANRAPTITGTPTATIAANTAYNFRPVGADPDGDTLTYSIQNRPSWASFSTSTGRLSGTPTSANVGTSARITISVSDGEFTTSLPSFTIQVLASGNRAPTISGTPITSILALLPYAFTPRASDPDGDALTFSIQNKPAWATFNTTTGRLSGTPTLADITSFGNIVITVSDGSATASLPAFGISVLNSATGTATVGWSAPTENTDGTSLTDLSSYRLVYGQDPEDLGQSITIGNANTTSYTVEDLTPGTWYFGLRAVNSTGVESAVSNLGTKTIQ
jgi:hypothetical protein